MAKPSLKGVAGFFNLPDGEGDSQHFPWVAMEAFQGSNNRVLDALLSQEMRTLKRRPMGQTAAPTDVKFGGRHGKLRREPSRRDATGRSGTQLRATIHSLSGVPLLMNGSIVGSVLDTGRAPQAARSWLLAF